VDIEDFAIRDGDFLYLALPRSAAGFLSARSDTRVNPLYLSRPRRTTLRTEVELPAGFGVKILPDTILRRNVAEAGIEVNHRTRTHKKGESLMAFCDTDAGYDPAVIEPFRYKDLLDLDRSLSHRKARTIVLKKLAEEK
jgi:hypothetical protein